ncbi:MAG: glycerophosphoryl diester phosphodiesterase [Alphaproteobacteria bacterium]|nr:MAG: glycerophosphoryl diester phosphodiesterase [Alphaproteobacteria bacterium]
MALLPALIGHRGSAATAPENTLSGIRAAYEAGAGAVEVDVKLTRDGVAVLMHDDTLARTTNGVGRMVDADWATVKGLDAGYASRFGTRFADEPVPRLDAVLTCVIELGMAINLEIKPCPGRERETALATVEAVRRLWPADRPWPVLSSFQRDCLVTVREVAPDLPRGYLVEALGPDWLAEATALGVATVHPGRKHLSDDQARSVVASGLPLIVWTVNDDSEAKHLLGLGAAGIITDDPASLMPLFVKGI